MRTSGAKGDYCVEVQFNRGAERPSRIFQAMSQLIESFQSIDLDLARSLAADIEPLAVLEEVEAGSIRAWLSVVLRSVDDEALRELSAKKLIGSYLVKGKQMIVEFLEGKSGIGSQRELHQLEESLFQLAAGTEIRQLPAYSPVPARRLLTDLNAVGAAMAQLGPGESAALIIGARHITINPDFRVPEESMVELLTKETLRSEAVMILKVKKPDYLGQSMWEFRHETRTIPAKISDRDWLVQFQSRQVLVKPGDSIRARVATAVNYDRYGEVVGQNYEITQVLEVVPLPTWVQGKLPLDFGGGGQDGI